MENKKIILGPCTRALRASIVDDLKTVSQLFESKEATNYDECIYESVKRHCNKVSAYLFQHYEDQITEWEPLVILSCERKDVDLFKRCMRKYNNLHLNEYSISSYVIITENIEIINIYINSTAGLSFRMGHFLCLIRRKRIDVVKFILTHERWINDISRIFVITCNNIKNRENDAETRATILRDISPKKERSLFYIFLAMIIDIDNSLRFEECMSNTTTFELMIMGVDIQNEYSKIVRQDLEQRKALIRQFYVDTPINGSLDIRMIEHVLLPYISPEKVNINI